MVSEIEHLTREYEEVLAALPMYPQMESRALRLSKGFGTAGYRDNSWYNPRTGRILYPRTLASVEYPALEQLNGNTWMVWMSASPLECLSMKSHCKKAAGHVLIGGLGLGILSWLCASKPLVKTVTVIELQQSVIDLIAPVIDHPKITIVQDDVWDYIGNTQEKYDFVSLDIWSDMGRAVLESFESKRYAQRVLKRGGFVRTWLDEIANRLNRTDALMRAVEQAQKTQGSMLERPKMIDNKSCDFCGATPFIDCYGFCLECFVKTGICEYAGNDIIDKVEKLRLRAMNGELNHLIEPYPELHGHL